MIQQNLCIFVVVAQFLLYIAFTTSFPIPAPQKFNAGIPVAGRRPDPDGEFPWLPAEFQTWDSLNERGLYDEPGGAPDLQDYSSQHISS